MERFAGVNRLVTCGIDQYRIQSFAGTRLHIVGSSDICYYHDVEIILEEVQFISCMTNFRLLDISEVELNSRDREVILNSDEGLFKIIAERVAVQAGKVYYYDRGTKLRPGERIAEWVERENPGPGQ